MADRVMISGFGKFHTNDPDPDNPQKKLTPYIPLGWSYIRQMVDHPQEGIDKDKAQWLIPSTFHSRKHREQEEHGSFLLLWQDLDYKDGPGKSLEEVSRGLVGIIGDADFELYASRSATTEKQKARLLIPTLNGLSGSDWTLCQEVLADKLREAGIEPDLAALGCGQVLYLPNRGAYYRTVSTREGRRFDAMTAFAGEVAVKRQAIALGKAEVERRKAAALEKRQALRHDARASVIDAFNSTYSVEEILMQHNYDQRGEHFRHPASETGSYSAHVRDGRVHTLSSADPLYTGDAGGGAHDAFSAFCTLKHGGDTTVAMKDAGDNLLRVESGASWNKARQREYVKAKRFEELSRADYLPGIDDPIDEDAAPALIPESTGKRFEKSAFHFAHVSELLADHAPPVWLIDDILEAGTLGQVFGASGCGKSFLVMDWAACIASGLAWSGKAVAPGAVFYIAGEGFSGFKRRLRAWELHTGNTLGTAPLFFSKQPAALMDSVSAVSIIAAVKELQTEHGKPALIVIDTLHRNMGDGDENNAGDVALFLQSLDAMRAEFGAAVLIVHHSGHAESGRGRGSSSLRAAVDHEYLLTKHADGRRELTCTKAKEAEPAPAMWFDLQHVDLDWPDGKGGLQSSAVLASASEPTPEANYDKTAKLTGALRIAHKALLDALATDWEDTGESIKAEFGDRSPARVVHEDVWRNRCYMAGVSDGDQGAKQKAFIRARKALIDRGIVSTWDSCYWLFGVCFSLDDESNGGGNEPI
ncbi:MAG: AAA family ATPase [Dechloromonas sp.]|nr:AAA family ATPase [Dechloromonas sp.]